MEAANSVSLFGQFLFVGIDYLDECLYSTRLLFPRHSSVSNINNVVSCGVPTIHLFDTLYSAKVL